MSDGESLARGRELWEREGWHQLGRWGVDQVWEQEWQEFFGHMIVFSSGSMSVMKLGSQLSLSGLHGSFICKKPGCYLERVQETPGIPVSLRGGHQPAVCQSLPWDLSLVEKKQTWGQDFKHFLEKMLWVWLISLLVCDFIVSAVPFLLSTPFFGTSIHVQWMEIQANPLALLHKCKGTQLWCVDTEQRRKS